MKCDSDSQAGVGDRQMCIKFIFVVSPNEEVEKFQQVKYPLKSSTNSPWKSSGTHVRLTFVGWSFDHFWATSFFFFFWVLH